MDEKKKQALDIALGQIEKQFGKGSIMRMSEDSIIQDVEAVSTGSLGLDIALGIGGFPRGRVVEIYGPESSGKTTLALHAAAEIQKAGGTAAFVDAEHALDPKYAEKLGVEIEDLLISQPDTGEQALEITDMLVRSGAVDLVIIDSVAALTPKAEIEGDIGNETRVKVLKNKVAPPFKEVIFDILYGEGISRESEIISLGTQHDILEKSGAWYSYNGERIGQGKENVRVYLKDNPEIAREVEAKIREKVLPDTVKAVEEQEQEAET
jgi:recombination protein RecA